MSTQELILKNKLYSIPLNYSKIIKTFRNILTTYSLFHNKF